MDQNLAYILPDGHDLPLLVPITGLSFQSNTLVDWVYAYASVASQSACWVYTEITHDHGSQLPMVHLQFLPQIGLGYSTSRITHIPGPPSVLGQSSGVTALAVGQLLHVG